MGTGREEVKASGGETKEREQDLGTQLTLGFDAPWHIYILSCERKRNEDGEGKGRE